MKPKLRFTRRPAHNDVEIRGLSRITGKMELIGWCHPASVDRVRKGDFSLVTLAKRD